MFFVLPRIREGDAALVIQLIARSRKSKRVVMTMKRMLVEAAAAICLQCFVRVSASKKTAARLRQAKKIEFEQKCAKEEAARKFAEEERKRLLAEKLEKIKENEIEMKKAAFKEMAERQKERDLQRAENVRRREEAEKAIDTLLFGDVRGIRPSLDANLVWEKRRTSMMGALTNIICDWSTNAPPPAATFHDGSDHTHGDIAQEPSGQQVDEEMLAGLGELSKLDTLSLNVEHIEDGEQTVWRRVAYCRSVARSFSCLQVFFHKFANSLRYFPRSFEPCQAWSHVSHIFILECEQPLQLEVASKSKKIRTPITEGQQNLLLGRFEVSTEVG